MSKKPKPHELQSREKRIRLGIEHAKPVRILLPERHLFVTEGTKTEPYYLNGMIDRICKQYGEECRRQLQVYGEGLNTLGLLERAESLQTNDTNSFQHVWLFYDLDDFPRDSFDNVLHRCNALNERNQARGGDTVFHAIWSNECFEIWFLLHFEYINANVGREQYWKMLSHHMRQAYRKNDPSIFNTLWPQLPQARKNAKKLFYSYLPDCPPSQRAPGTMAFELIDVLEPYLNFE